MTRREPAWRGNPSPSGAWTTLGVLGLKRLRPEHRDAIPKVVAYCHKVFDEQLPFDYELSDDDKALYCVEMTEKAYRSAGIKLSNQVKVGDFERAADYPICLIGLGIASKFQLNRPLTADTLVYLPGNERHGIWAAKQLMTVIPPTYAPGYPDMSNLLPAVPRAPAGEQPRSKKALTPRERREATNDAPPGEKVVREGT
jgi:hypothetical protein